MSTISHIAYGRLASRSVRWFAAAIDLLILLVALAPVLSAADSYQATLLLHLLPLLLYSVGQAYLLLGDGQTIGKKVMGIRIVSVHTGDRPGWFSLLLVRRPLIFLLLLIPLVGLLCLTADHLFIFREDRRCLHDLIAGTAVVNV